MKYYRFINYLQDKKAYWQAKRLSTSIARNSASRTNSTRQFLGEQRIQFQLLWHSFRGMPYQLLIAVVFIIIIELASAFAHSTLGWQLSVSTDNEDTLVQLLTALVTVLGVVLGLYFAALSAAAGNLFIRAPASLQRLFISDREGRQYIQTLVLATLIGIIYLLGMSAGYQPSIIGPAGLVIVSAYVAMRFITLGGQAFYFIHPVKASAKLQGDIQAAIDNVKFNRRVSKHPNIQAVSHQKAIQALHTFDKLVDFGINPAKLSGQQLFAVANYVAFSLKHYIADRGKIPTNSAWFTTKSKHQKWLLSDSDKLVVALNTGTGLQPDSVRHMEWFEEKALRIILKVLRHLIEIKDWSSAQACMEILVELASYSGKYLAKTTTSLIVDKTIQEISEALGNMESGKTPQDIEGMLSLYEGIGRLPTAALLGVLRAAHDLSAEQLVTQLDGIKWSRTGDFYKHDLPMPLIPELEKIQHQFDNERAIEGKIVSPKWYLRTLALHHYLSAAKSYYDQVKSYEAIYRLQTANLIKATDYMAAACVASCSMEYASKLVDLGQDVSRLIKEGEAFHGFKDLKWVTIDTEVEKKEIIKLYNDAVDRMIGLIPYLIALPKNTRDDFPDYLGQAIVFGMEAVYNAAQNNDHTRLKRIFRQVLVGTLMSKEYVLEDVKGWLPESQMALVSEPIEDIMSLSGFIKIYSELHGNSELWKVCEDSWNAFLGGDGVDAPVVIRMLSATATYRDSLHSITPRASLRFTWDTRLRGALEEAGVSTELHPNLFGHEDTPPTHSSPLVRIVARGAGMLDSDARTIFLSLYLSHTETAQGLDIDFPDRRDFKRMYENETKRHEQEDTDE